MGRPRCVHSVITAARQACGLECASRLLGVFTGGEWAHAHADALGRRRSRPPACSSSAPACRRAGSCRGLNWPRHRRLPAPRSGRWRHRGLLASGLVAAAGLLGSAAATTAAGLVVAGLAVGRRTLPFKQGARTRTIVGAGFGLGGCRLGRRWRFAAWRRRLFADGVTARCGLAACRGGSGLAWRLGTALADHAAAHACCRRRGRRRARWRQWQRRRTFLRWNLDRDVDRDWPRLASRTTAGKPITPTPSSAAAPIRASTRARARGLHGVGCACASARLRADDPCRNENRPMRCVWRATCAL